MKDVAKKNISDMKLGEDAVVEVNVSYSLQAKL